MKYASVLFVAGIASVVALVSLSLTSRFLRFAQKRGLMDVPNARSSHETPRPRGGGVAIVITVVVALTIAGLLQFVPWRIVAGLITSGVIVAAVGYADDHRDVSPTARLGGHLAAAALAIAFIGTGPVSHELHLSPAFEFFAPIVTAFCLVWMLNLTNFMDGIDGLASVETITVCVGGMLCVMVYQYQFNSGSLIAPLEPRPGFRAAFYAPLLLASATAGFLFWNWPPAKIFMGDAGSGFLGLTLGTLSIVAAMAAPQLLWSWLILLAVFIVDATVTLVRRMARREKFYLAHRTHAYQHAAVRWGHQRVTLAVGAVNVFWLIPLALAVATTRLNAFSAIAIACVPLVIGALYLKAGQPE